MFKKPEQFTEMGSQCVNTACDFAQTSLESLEKLTQLQLSNSKKILDETSKALKEVSELENPKDMFDKINHLATQAVESNIDNCRNIYEVISDAQTKFSKMLESQFQKAQANIVDSVDSLSKFSPVSTSNNVVTDSVKTWMNNTNQAMSAMSKVASQVTEFTNNNVKTATSATVSAVKKATK